MTGLSMKSLIWIALIIGFAAFGYPQSRPPKDIRISGQYFPQHTFDSEPDRDAFVVDWYSKHLAAMQELSLWEILKSPTQHVYRFLWLRTFHAPIVIRLNVNPDGTGVLTTKMTNGKGGYQAGSLTKNRSETLSEDQTQ
jgi:hypothetical protein